MIEGVIPALEPETVEATLTQARVRATASIIARLLNENEPMLRAKAEGATVTVQVIGERKVQRFTVEEAALEPGS